MIPQLAAEYPNLNGDLTPHDVFPGERHKGVVAMPGVRTRVGNRAQ